VFVDHIHRRVCQYRLLLPPVGWDTRTAVSGGVGLWAGRVAPKTHCDDQRRPARASAKPGVPQTHFCVPADKLPRTTNHRLTTNVVNVLWVFLSRHRRLVATCCLAAARTASNRKRNGNAREGYEIPYNRHRRYGRQRRGRAVRTKRLFLR